MTIIQTAMKKKQTIMITKTGDFMDPRPHKGLKADKTAKMKRIIRMLLYLLVFFMLSIITGLSWNKYSTVSGSGSINHHLSLLQCIGVMLLSIAAPGISFLAFYRLHPVSYSGKEFVLIVATMLFSICLAVGGSIISIFLIPYGFWAMLLVLIYDPTTALLTSLPMILVIYPLTGFNPYAMILQIVSCLSAVLLTKTVIVRNNLTFGALLSGLLNCFVLLAICLVKNQLSVDFILHSGFVLLGSMLSSILVIGIQPILEHFFEIITSIKLLELVNPNEPLLKKMLFEAPGTYHHSIVVGNLAEAAAEAIGSNAMLARTGAYYHDIGKIKRPYFFKENQIGFDNPHDKITPKLSTAILHSHVKDGIELAKLYKIPGYIQKIIEEHHGTSLVKYFYTISLKEATEPEEVDERYFRYAGPLPSTKESGIVMLADSVEASVRSIASPTLADIDAMVERIFKDRIDDGQLDFCNLTMKDLSLIKITFKKVLGGIFHSRIDYPDMNEIAVSEERTHD